MVDNVRARARAIGVASLLVATSLPRRAAADTPPTTPDPIEAAEAPRPTPNSPSPPTPPAPIPALAPSKPKDLPPALTEPLAVPPGPHRLTWKTTWRRTDALDYALTFSAAVLYTVVLVAPTTDQEPQWTGPILFDRPVRDALVNGTRDERTRASKASDVLLYGSIAQVVAVDALGVALLGDRNPDVSFQMLTMDAEAYAMTLLVTGLTKRFTARERPYAQGCANDPTYSGGCNSVDQNYSFVSGHASMTATSAGLVCSQHLSLPLYGGAWDPLACATSIAMTAATGALRIASDNHWASDVLAGQLIGFSSGFFLPLVFHFRERPASQTASAVRVHVMPTGGPGSLRLTAMGTF